MPKPNETAPDGVMLDNATLRGALIALGHLDPPHADPSEPIKVFDVHMASAEVLIEGLLLYDHIYIPKIHEDYPTTVARLQAVVGSNLVRELPITPAQIKTIEQFATQDFASWPLADDHLVTRLQEFTGIKVPTLKWDRWVFEKYEVYSVYHEWKLYTRSLSEYAVNHLDDVSVQGAQELSARITSLLPHGSNVPKLDLMNAAILWLAYRTCVYDCLSWVTGIPYTPHPQRAALWKAVNTRRTQPAIFSEAPFDVLFDARLTVGEQVNKAAGLQLYDLEIPPFFTYILAKSSSPFDVLHTLMELRQEPGLKALRTILQDISASLNEKGSVSKILGLKQEFDQLRRDLIGQYHDPTLPKISPTIQLAGAVGVQFDVPLPRGLTRLSSRFHTINKPHLAVLRDIFKVTTDIWKLSRLYDKVYRGRQILLSETIKRPSHSKSRVEFSEQRFYYVEDAEKRARDDPLEVEDPEFDTPLQCRERLASFLLDEPAEPCQLALIDIDNLDVYNERSRRLGNLVLYNVGLLVREIGNDPISKVAGDTFIVVILGKFSDNWLQELRAKISALSLKEWASKELREFFEKEWRDKEWPKHRGRKWEEQHKEEEEWVSNKLRETPPFPIEQVSISAGVATSPTDGNLADDLFKVAYERLEAEKSKKNQRRRQKDKPQAET